MNGQRSIADWRESAMTITMRALVLRDREVKTRSNDT